MINLYFQEELSRLAPGEIYVTVFHTFLEELIHSIHYEQHQLHSRITQSMEGLIGWGIKFRELLYNGDIDSEDYLLIKADCERRMVVLSQELQEFTIIQVKKRAKVGKHAHVLQAIGKLYERLSLPIKRQLIALILSEKAVLEPGSFDRAINQAVATIFRRRQYQPHQESSPLVREKGGRRSVFYNDPGSRTKGRKGNFI